MSKIEETCRKVWKTRDTFPLSPSTHTHTCSKWKLLRKLVGCFTFVQWLILGFIECGENCHKSNEKWFGSNQSFKLVFQRVDFFKFFFFLTESTVPFTLKLVHADMERGVLVSTINPHSVRLVKKYFLPYFYVAFS